MTIAYPLQWPRGWKRSEYQARANFKARTIANVYENLCLELGRLKATQAVLSSNLILNKDGAPRSDQKQPVDRGVVVYFHLEGKAQCIPCDKWDKVEDNIWAIFKSIEAIRGLERWGAKEMVNAAFRGFQALPDYSGTAIIPVNDYFKGCDSQETIKARYLQLAKQLHPDMGGDEIEFKEMKRQYEMKMNV